MTLRLIILLLTIAISSSSYAELRGLPHITILAASSLTEPITEIARLYSRNKNITVTASYDATSDQVYKIKQGESADVFISSHPEWIKKLKQQGLIDVYSITNLVKNKLVIIAKKNNSICDRVRHESNILNKLSLIHQGTILTVGAPDTTALGSYTKQAIDNLQAGLWDKLSSNMLRLSSAKDILYLVSNSNRTGISYFSEAYGNDEIEIIGTFDESLHEPVIYQAAVVAGENMAYARDFLDFLKSPTAKSIIAKYGFSTD